MSIQTIYVDVGTSFSMTPGGRLRRDGPYSGEEFREDIIEPILDSGKHVMIDLADPVGFLTVFFYEVFGGLVERYSPLIKERVKICSAASTARQIKALLYLDRAIDIYHSDFDEGSSVYTKIWDKLWDAQNLDDVHHLKTTLLFLRKIYYLTRHHHECLSWNDPHFVYNDSKEVVLEWWCDTRKLTIYLEHNTPPRYLQVEGESTSIIEGDVTNFVVLWRWLKGV